MKSRAKIEKYYNRGKRNFQNIDFDFGETFENSTFENSTFEGCYFGVNFRNSNFKNAIFLACNMKSTDFRNCDFSNAKISNCLMEASDFGGTIIDNITFENNTSFGAKVNLNTETLKIEIIENFERRNTTIFNRYWELNFSELLPFGHELRMAIPERWLRIHNLPHGKRYAETTDEYQIIFDRQNQLFRDIIGEGTEMIMIFCNYHNDITNLNYPKLPDFTKFEKINSIELHKIQPEEYDKGRLLDVFTRSDKWRHEKFNITLKAIADDEIRMLFICPSLERIIAPYDGGVDVFMESQLERNKWRRKYKNWLSERKDGL